MKNKLKPTGKTPLVDLRPIYIPRVSSTTPSASAARLAASVANSISISKTAGGTAKFSRGTQTGENLAKKRRLIRKQLAVLLHAVLCRVRDSLLPNSEQRAPCSTAFCGLMKTVLDHLRTCPTREACPFPHCRSSRQILMHWKTCTQTDCPVCSPLRRVVPAYLDSVLQNPRWRHEIMTRFEWLITFVAPVHFNIPQPQPARQENNEEANAAKNAEE